MRQVRYRSLEDAYGTGKEVFLDHTDINDPHSYSLIQKLWDGLNVIGYDRGDTIVNATRSQISDWMRRVRFRRTLT